MQTSFAAPATGTANPSTDAPRCSIESVDIITQPGEPTVPIKPREGNILAISDTGNPDDLAGSDANQTALEDRFIALYEVLMEKQISFKERVEPFKTDNQNAGKG